MIAHLWVAVATFPLSEEEAGRLSRATDGDPVDPPIDLDAERATDISAGCYRCERPVAVAFGTGCPGEAS